MKGESISELTLRQARALRTALDTALASYNNDPDGFARDEDTSSRSSGRELVGEASTHGQLRQS